MTDVVAFADAEAVLYSWLTTSVAAYGDSAVVVGTLIPNPRPPRLVRALRKGGTSTSVILDRPVMVFDCWGDTEAGAADLARLVRALIGAMPGRTIDGVFCSDVTEVGGPYNNPDPDSASPRYTFAALVTLGSPSITTLP